MERLLEYIKANTSSKLVKTAIDVARKNSSLQEEMLIYVFKYLTQENKEMEKTLKDMLKQKRCYKAEYCANRQVS